MCSIWAGWIWRGGPSASPLAETQNTRPRSRQDSVVEHEEGQSINQNQGYQNILVERRGAVGIVTLNRPTVLNALNAALIAELSSALDDFEGDVAIGAIILTGGE